MIANAPRLRSDLTVSEQRTAGAPCVVIKDPLTSEFFRFGETEQFIAQQCDGETPLEVIRQRTEQKFGATLPAENLRAFIRNLDSAGLLEGDETESARAGKRGRGRRQGRLRGSLLYLRVKVADPNRLFDRLMPHVRGFFTPGFLVVGAAVILLAVVAEKTGYPAQMLELDMELDSEGESRRLLAACGLEWEDGCLEFHCNPTVTTTASASQVRRISTLGRA